MILKSELLATMRLILVEYIKHYYCRVQVRTSLRWRYQRI